MSTRVHLYLRVIRRNCGSIMIIQLLPLCPDDGGKQKKNTNKQKTGSERQSKAAHTLLSCDLRLYLNTVSETDERNTENDPCLGLCYSLSYCLVKLGLKLS